MKNYVLIYHNESPMEGAPNPEVLKAWHVWFDGMGDKLVDAGNPFGEGKSVSSDGEGAASAAATGYSIVKTDSLESAMDLAKGCPVLGAPGTVDVYETFPM